MYLSLASVDDLIHEQLPLSAIPSDVAKETNTHRDTKAHAINEIPCHPTFTVCQFFMNETEKRKRDNFRRQLKE